MGRQMINALLVEVDGAAVGIVTRSITALVVGFSFSKTTAADSPCFAWKISA